MSDWTITLIIASLAITLGVLILAARFNAAPFKREDRNPSAKAARGQIIVLAIFLIIGGLIVLMREL